MKSVILTLYFLLLVYIVFISGNDYRYNHVFKEFGSINLVPFKEKVEFLQHPEQWPGNNMQFFLKEVFGNLLLLFPFPLIVVLINGLKSYKKVIFYSFLISFSIETIQFLTGLGNADIDDVLLNTLGAVLGTYLALTVKKQNFWRIIQSSLNLPS